MTDRWLAIHDEANAPPFHATDLFALGRKYRKAGWDEDKRDEFIDALLKILLDSKPHLIGAGVRLTNYEAVRASYPNVGLSAYQLCCYECVRQVSGIARNLDVEPISVTFEARRGWSHPFYEKLLVELRDLEKQKLYGIEHIGISPKGPTQLDIADLVANEVYRYHVLGGSSYRGPFRDSSLKLFSAFGARDGGILSEQAVTIIFEAFRNM